MRSVLDASNRVCRFALLCWVLMASGCHWVLEQPGSSLMFRHRRFQEMLQHVHVTSPASFSRSLESGPFKEMYKVGCDSLEPRYFGNPFGWDVWVPRHPNDQSCGPHHGRSGSSSIMPNLQGWRRKDPGYAWHAIIGTLEARTASRDARRNKKTQRTLSALVVGCVSTMCI